MGEFQSNRFSMHSVRQLSGGLPRGNSPQGPMAAHAAGPEPLQLLPEKIDMIRNNLVESHNVFAEENEERADWVEDCDDSPDEGFCREAADIVYFTGCVAAFYPVA